MTGKDGRAGWKYRLTLIGISACSVWCLHLLLKLSWQYCLFAGIAFFFLLQKHRQKSEKAQEEWQYLEEIFLYMELVLHAFARHQKISQAWEETLFGLPEGRLKRTVQEALRQLRQSSDRPQDTALAVIEAVYPCKRLAAVHAFLRKVENYGGEVQSSVQILLQDKIRWEKRMRQDRKERKNMFVQVLLSCAASLLICGIVMYMPVQGMDISGNGIVQMLTVIVLFLDDMILLKAQNYLIVDWRGEEGGKDRKEMLTAYRERDEKKEWSLSIRLALLPLAAALLLLWKKKLWLFSLMAAVMLFCLNQHRIGRKLSERKLSEEISREFPKWLLEVALLLQGENVHTAIEKSIPQAPGILQRDLQLLIARLELNPEGASAYHRFFEDFDLPAVRTCMCSLYGIANGTAVDGARQLQELVDTDLELLDSAEAGTMHEKTGGMYLLFLLPVVTASVKLVVDMSIFLLGFLAQTR